MSTRHYWDWHGYKSQARDIPEAPYAHRNADLVQRWKEARHRQAPRKKVVTVMWILEDPCHRIADNHRVKLGAALLGGALVEAARTIDDGGSEFESEDEVTMNRKRVANEKMQKTK